jgi:hypothetical protein
VDILVEEHSLAEEDIPAVEDILAVVDIAAVDNLVVVAVDNLLEAVQDTVGTLACYLGMWRRDYMQA